MAEANPLPRSDSTLSEETEVVTPNPSLITRASTKDLVAWTVATSLDESGALGTKEKNASKKLIPQLSNGRRKLAKKDEEDDYNDVYMRFNRMKQEQNYFGSQNGPNVLECILSKPKIRLPDINQKTIDVFDGLDIVDENEDEENLDPSRGGQLDNNQRGTLKPGIMNTINAEYESFDYTETSSALRYVSGMYIIFVSTKNFQPHH